MESVVVLSGGMDSATLLWKEYAETGGSCAAVSIDYGQRHDIELTRAEALCNRLGVGWRCVDLTGLGDVLSGSALTSPEVAVPHGHYAEESMKVTVVPNRNMILLAVATGYAITKKAKRICYAAHAGDHAIYPDCREEFASAMASAIGLCDWHPIELSRPFVHNTKADIVRMGHDLGVPFELTWSCYEGGLGDDGQIHCGACGTCVERIEAFDLAGVPDPTQYRNRVAGVPVLDVDSTEDAVRLAVDAAKAMK